MSVDVNEILSRLSPGVREKVSTGDMVSCERQLTPSVSLNRALRGGLGYGRQVLVWGNKSSGKSSMCLQTLGLAQQDGKLCAWVDAENSFDSEWARRLGVNVEELIVVNAKTMNEMVDVCIELMELDVDLIVVDSITSLLPAIYFDKKGDVKELSDTGQIGSAAKDTTRAVKMLNYANKNTLLIMISQSTTFISAMYTKQTPTNGLALQFFSSTVIQLFASEAKDNLKMGHVKVGDKLIEVPFGRDIDWVINFNKLGPPRATGSYTFLFEGDHVGVDGYSDAVRLALSLGIVEKKGSWYTYKDVRAQGEDNLVEAMRMAPEVYQELLDDLRN